VNEVPDFLTMEEIDKVTAFVRSRIPELPEVGI
jgi:hypothetical protein